MGTVQVTVHNSKGYIENIILHSNCNVKLTDDMTLENLDLIEKYLPQKHRGGVISLTRMHDFILVEG